MVLRTSIILVLIAWGTLGSALHPIAFDDVLTQRDIPMGPPGRPHESRPVPVSSPTRPVRPTFIPSNVAFLDAAHGIAVGALIRNDCVKQQNRCRGRIEVTTDGGRTWTVTAATRYPVGYVVVAGPSDVWAGESWCPNCQWQIALGSTDGGRRWHRIGRTTAGDWSFVSSNLGWGVRAGGPHHDDGVLVRTRDGGRSWRFLSRPCGDDLRNWGQYPAFVGRLHGWILCDGEPGAGSQFRTLFETQDGGRTWSRIAGIARIGSGGSYPEAMTFESDGHGWIGLGYASGRALVSRDGGRHWRYGGRVDRTGSQAGQLSFVTDSVGFTLDPTYGVQGCHPTEALLGTTDGGVHWRPIHLWASRVC